MPTKAATLADLQRARAKPRGATSHVERLRRRNDEVQEAVDKLRSTRRWRDVRTAVLAREPLCRDCVAAGRTVLAKTVDHVISLRLRIDLAYDLDNLAPLCVFCHAKKSARERTQRKEQR
jgi:5-methylcytosine-specific restriction protein A